MHLNLGKMTEKGEKKRDYKTSKRIGAKISLESVQVPVGFFWVEAHVMPFVQSLKIQVKTHCAQNVLCELSPFYTLNTQPAEPVQRTYSQFTYKCRRLSCNNKFPLWPMKLAVTDVSPRPLTIPHLNTRLSGGEIIKVDLEKKRAIRAYSFNFIATITSRNKPDVCIDNASFFEIFVILSILILPGLFWIACWVFFFCLFCFLVFTHPHKPGNKVEVSRC